MCSIPIRRDNQRLILREPIRTIKEIALKQVMLIDDDRTTTALLQTLLELDGFAVTTVGRGSMVMDKAREAKPALIMIDYNLVDMKGTDIIVQLRATAEFAKTPIVMSSGLNVEDEAMKAGATVFLIKPFEPDRLGKLFNELISKAGA